MRNELLKLFPNYKYQPRKPGEKKKRTKRGPVANGQTATVGDLDEVDVDNIELENTLEEADEAAQQVKPNLVVFGVSEESEQAQADDIAAFNEAQSEEDAGEGSSMEQNAVHYDDILAVHERIDEA